MQWTQHGGESMAHPRSSRGSILAAGAFIESFASLKFEERVTNCQIEQKKSVHTQKKNRNHPGKDKSLSGFLLTALPQPLAS
jgi:hypothetical protein